MDKTRLDEAVSVAVDAYADAAGEGWQLPARAGVRAAILAALPVLLGEPVAWQEVKDDGEPEWHDASFAETATPFDRCRPLYAPDLGGGK